MNERMEESSPSSSTHDMDSVQQQPQHEENNKSSNDREVDNAAVHDIIPESLLAIAKDTRYIQQFYSLLQQVLEALGILLGSSNIDFSRQLDSNVAMKRQLWLVSYLFYILFAVGPSHPNQTLGMQALGLTFMKEDDDNGTRTKYTILFNKSRRIFASLLCTAIMGLIMNYYSCIRPAVENDTTNVRHDNRTSIVSGTVSLHNNLRHQESLRGNDRRQMYEQLRRQMLSRGSRSSNDNDNATSAAHVASILNPLVQQQSNNTTSTAANTQSTLLRRLSAQLRQLFKSILDACFYNEGPHDIVVNNTLNVPPTAYSMGIWMIRLHLSQFLITGKYPTIFHRILGLQPQSMNKEQQQQQQISESNGSILFRPQTNRMIALLILLQASSAIIRKTANWLAQRAATLMLPSATNRQRDSYVSRLELKKSMAKYFSSNNNIGADDDEENIGDNSVTHDSRVTDGAILDNANHNKRQTLCTICRTERLYPAASINCGHVCCWNCLIQWVTNVRQECPLCRAPCRPQDVLALYRYEPADADAENDDDDIGNLV